MDLLGRGEASAESALAVDELAAQARLHSSAESELPFSFDCTYSTRIVHFNSRNSVQPSPVMCHFGKAP